MGNIEIGLGIGIGISGGASDTTAPTCTITCAQSSPSATTPLNFTFTFSESVTGFVVGDITVGNGSAGNFAGSGAVYTCDVTPTAYEVTVDVAAGVCIDGAGNANLAATQFAISSLVYWYLAGAVPAANCKAAYQPVGAASLAASYIDIASTFDITAIDAPTFNSATGWTFNGTSDVLNTGYVPPNQVTRSAIVRISGASTGAANRNIFGDRNSVDGTYVVLRNTNNASKATFNNGSGTGITHTTNVAAGVLAIAGLDGYIDGSDVGNMAAGTYNMAAVTIHIGQANGIASEFYSGNIQAIAFYDITLTPAQVVAITAAMNALP